MKVKYTLNNYQVGAKLKTAPVHKMIRQERVDSLHTEVVFEITDAQKDFCDMLFAKKGKIIEG